VLLLTPILGESAIRFETRRQKPGFLGETGFQIAAYALDAAA
jgi:hypothetical protein